VRVCVVGSGGREHALACAIARTADVVVTPGNPGMGPPITVTDAPVEELEADLYVVGPEAPLVAGLADTLRARGKAVLGPGADGALLEGSKAFMKEVLGAAGVPTAAFATFDALEEADALAYLETLPGPWVIKTDGLAAGKGVLVARTLDEARADVTAKLSGRSFGEAGRHVVIEEGLAGEECSLLVLCDGTWAVPLVPAQDFKRIGDGDAGPNTGGMGAFSPLPDVADTEADEILEAVHLPVLRELASRGTQFQGLLYAGLMRTDDGLRVIEFNCRFGDPETQSLLPRLETDLLPLLAGDLSHEPEIADRAAVTVVLSGGNYPERGDQGTPIEGVEAAEATGALVFHAGTALHDGRLVTNGGRILNVVGVGETVADARSAAYEAAARIDFAGMHFRSDIAADG